MSNHEDPKPPQNHPLPLPPLPPPPPLSSAKISDGYSGGSKHHFPNPPDRTNPDPATLREQWRFAIRQYSRWYSQAWGTAILAGISFFALGWIIKGSNPLPSHKPKDEDNPSSSSSNSHDSEGVVDEFADRPLNENA
ncbi:unnamed protein product [Ilex paraguariensis]|uniref:Uncharacterized protein n=1 Tax=Ilex paraguariensis TaxID=185542 RepID=A0ABC8ULD9_9AQUA